MSATPPARSLYLDIQAAQDPLHPERGIPRYAGMHAAALADVPGAVCRLALHPVLGPPRSLPPRYRSSPLLCWNGAAEIGRARRDHPIAYHLMSPLHVWPSLERSFPFAALTPDDALVVTMYDAVPLLEPREYLQNRFALKSVRSRFDVLRSADLVLTLSRHGSAELVELLDLDPCRVAWIGGGVDPFFSPAAEGEDPGRATDALPSLRHPYVMCVTHHYERKNTDLLLRGFGLLPAALRRDLQLVLVGSLDDIWRRRFRDVAHASGIGDDQLVLPDRVTDATLRTLYRHARLFVAPSLSEGWGLPVAEAAACGCPAITSDTSALPEVLDYPPSTFDPRDPVALAAVMERALEDREFRDELTAVGTARARDHRWSAVADRTLAALARVERREQRRPTGHRSRAPARRDRAATARLRIAFAGRVAVDGAAEDRYNAELVTGLADHADVDVYVPGDHPGRHPAPPTGAAATYPLGALGPIRSPHAYDVVVHSLGNGPDSSAQLAAAAHAPGIVWLHGPELAMPAPAPPSIPGELMAPEHRPRPNPRLLAGARAVLVDWEADQRLLTLARAAGELPIESIPLGIGHPPSTDTAGSAGAVALVIGSAPDDAFAVSWLDALLAPEARHLGMHAVIVGEPQVVSTFTTREPFVVGTQAVVEFAPCHDREAFQQTLRGARVVVDATRDACTSTMLARACLDAGRRVVSQRAAMVELGPSFLRMVGDDEDPLEVLLDERQAPAPPPYPVSIDDVVARVLTVVDRLLDRTTAA